MYAGPVLPQAQLLVSILGCVCFDLGPQLDGVCVGVCVCEVTCVLQLLLTEAEEPVRHSLQRPLVVADTPQTLNRLQEAVVHLHT